jgi:nitronate monooxygenase
MWPDRRLLELFEIEHPIVLAPMAGFGTVELAAEVADAGRLGSIGCATMNPQFAVETIARLRCWHGSRRRAARSSRRRRR